MRVGHAIIANRQTGSRFRATRWLGLIVRWTRVAAFCSVALAVVLAVNIRRVRADVGEKLFRLGRELRPMADLLGTAQRTLINGEAIYLASTVSDQPVGVVLDRFEQRCRQSSGGISEQLDAVPGNAKRVLTTRFPAAWQQRLGIVREQQGGEGMIACIEQSGRGGISAWVRRVGGFLADGELSHLGNLRYVYARTTDAGQTHVLTSFTQGAFNVYRVIGDGSRHPRDLLDGVPLPGDAVTPITIRPDGLPYALQAFRTPRAPAAVASEYVASLTPLGWKRVAGPGELFSNIVMERNGVMLLMNAAQLDDAGFSSVVITEASATMPPNPRGLSRGSTGEL